MTVCVFAAMIGIARQYIRSPDQLDGITFLDKLRIAEPLLIAGFASAFALAILLTARFVVFSMAFQLACLGVAMLLLTMALLDIFGVWPRAKGN